MTSMRDYFLCGVGGSGMLPLALILRATGACVSGSDRALDQGRTAPKFDFLRAQGIKLFPQDGSGVVDPTQIFVASAAIEETVPDVQAARRLGLARMTRAGLLAELFNASPQPIGVAGTSGKSTTTAMIAWILYSAGADPTVMNGAVMKNFAGPDALFASALVGKGTAFVSEIDESDGSIALFNPKIALLNNVTLDHKSIDELRALFGDFLGRAETAVINLDDPETVALAAKRNGATIGYSLKNEPGAELTAEVGARTAWSAAFRVTRASTGEFADAVLLTPGRHNISNALAAIGAAIAAGVSLGEAAEALSAFSGVKRRLELVGATRGVAVIDDFGHNPDKIRATLETLRALSGRLIVMFQPHGFGPLAKMKNEFIATFAAHLGADDILLMPEPVYFGGTVDRSVSSNDIVTGVLAANRRAEALPDRAACGNRIIELARPGDRVVVMGARDDTLSTFAEDLLVRLAAVSPRA